MKAVFLDRDGVINELIYYPEHGIMDSPFTAEQFRLRPGVGQVINKFHEMGYKVIVVSNQPGIAKGYITEEDFKKINLKMKRELTKEGTTTEGEYYCFHHPQAKIKKYRVNCDCRKPKPGMLLQAAEDLDVDLSQSWMVGDGLTDVQAGKKAGCRTILMGRMKCELCPLMDENDARPDAVCSDILEATKVIGTNSQHGGK